MGGTTGFFSLPHRVQTGSGAHLVFCPVGTRGSFSGSKGDHSLPSSAGLRMSGAITAFPYTPPWHGVLLSGGYVLVVWYFLVCLKKLCQL